MKNHPLLRFWNHAYSQYKEAEDLFNFPGFSDPIISANFKNRKNRSLNIIQDEDSVILNLPKYHLRNNFFLGDFRSLKTHPDFSYQVLPLKEGITNQKFWDLLELGFFKDYLFLKSFLPEVHRLNAEFQIGVITNQDKWVSSCLVGSTQGESILLSGVIHPEFRGLKISRKLKELIQYVSYHSQTPGEKDCFYWTISKKLESYADRRHRYLIYTPKRRHYEKTIDHLKPTELQ